MRLPIAFLVPLCACCLALPLAAEETTPTPPAEPAAVTDALPAASTEPTQPVAANVTPAAIETLVPLASGETTQAILASALKLAEEPAPEKKLTTEIDDWFGKNLVGPMWEYFLGIPLFQHDNQVITFVLAPDKGKDESAEVLAAKNLLIAELGRKKTSFNKADVVITTSASNVHLVLVAPEQAERALETLATLPEDKAVPRISSGLSLHGLTTVSYLSLSDSDESKAAASAVLDALATAGIRAQLAFARGFTTIAARDSNLDSGLAALQTIGAPIITGGATGKAGGVPFIVLVLVFGGLFFTLRWGFVNIRLFMHAIACVRGKFDNPDDDGEVTHFKALTSALSATVGLGNIAGVAVAITAGGAGAVFWMWIVAFFGMSMKFTSCTFAQLYRRVKADGSVLGGPMVYLDEGLREKGLKPLGKILGIMFAVFCICGAFGGGNMFQGNQTYESARNAFNIAEDNAVMPWVVGVIMAGLVSAVIIGGIKRIGSVTSKLVPLMCGVYCLVCLIIILANVGNIPHMLADIVGSAFSPQAAFGGFLGVLVQGMKRAAFSNEAGLGSAAIAHAAAKTKEPVREGVVAMLGPFIDTLVVCTMTALAILITNAHLDDNGNPVGMSGVEVTAKAFETLGGAVPIVLFIAVCIFAYSTMISWSYYGERATEYLVGEKGILPYRIVFCLAVVIGPVLSLGNVLTFSDLMLLSMAFPNIIGLVILSPKLGGLLKDYMSRLKSGQMHLSTDWRVHHPGDAKAEDAGGHG